MQTFDDAAWAPIVFRYQPLIEVDHMGSILAARLAVCHHE
jgi:hypothetical protein